MSEALKAAREIVDACAGENRPSPAWAAKVRDQIDAALTAGGQEPVAYEWRVGRSDRHNPDWWRWSKWQSGRKPDEPDRQYLRFEERPLYLAPPTAQLEALRNRVAELEKALEKSETMFEAISHHIDEHSFSFAKGFCSQGAFAARRVREGGKA